MSASVDAVRRYLAEYVAAQQANPRPSEFTDAQHEEEAARARLGSAAINALPELLAAFGAVHGPWPPGRPDWLVWSNEHRAWWQPARCGYNTSVERAGRYSLEEALACCSGRSRIAVPPHGWIPAEVPVPSPELVAALLPLAGLRPGSFVLQEYRSGYEREVTLECRRNERGDLWWLVKCGPFDLNRDLQFEAPPRASDDEKEAFFARARFPSAVEALALWRRWFALHPDPARPWLLADGTEEVL